MEICLICKYDRFPGPYFCQQYCFCRGCYYYSECDPTCRSEDLQTVHDGHAKRSQSH